MRLFRYALAGAVVVVLGATQAQAEPCGAPELVPGDPGVVAPNCIDCGPGTAFAGCTVYKYGLGHPDNFDYRRISPNAGPDFTRDDSTFPTGSYAFNRGLLVAVAGSRDCGPERDFQPIQGTTVLREQLPSVCTPSSTGPTGPGGCPVEIPRAVSGVTPVQNKTTWSNGALVIGALTSLLSSSSAVLGGTSNPNSAQCIAGNIRLVNARGTRYLLPNTHPLYNGTGQTYIKWLDSSNGGGLVGGAFNAAEGGLYRHEDDSEFCCTSPNGLNCATGGGTTPFQEYPIMTTRNCSQPGRIYQLLQTNSWIFNGGPGTPFISDPEHIVPGEVFGVCRNNRFQPCTLPAASALCGGSNPPICCATASCGTECNAFPGDTCDVRERGIRQTIPANLGTGFPDSARCNTFTAVLRGTPNQYCSVNAKYPVNGDPGSGCRVWNFGFRPRPDLNCDGVEDSIPNGGPSNDYCPFFNEYDYFADRDGDCTPRCSEGPTPGAICSLSGPNTCGSGTCVQRCRGDECECTDENQDGSNSVSDLVEINVGIFSPAQALTICDGNNDLNCNVQDIIASNIELFRPDSATCRHLTSIRCGNSVLDTGEACDDGAECVGGPTPGAVCDASAASTCGTGGTCTRFGGDGCSNICRIEPGFQCSGSPSVCTPL